MNDFDFKMRVTNRNEFFDHFLIKFNFIIVSLNWDDIMKKHYLRKTLTTRLTRYLISLNATMSFVVTCNRLRQFDRINSALDKEQDKIERVFFNYKVESRRTRLDNLRSNRIFTKDKSKKDNWIKRVENLSRQLRDELKRKRLCYKCDKSNHRSNDTSKCKKEISTTSKQLAKTLRVSLAKLAQMKIDDSDDVVDFDEDLNNWNFDQKNV